MSETIKRQFTTAAGRVDVDSQGGQFVALFVTTDLGRSWRMIPTPFAFHNTTEEAALGFHDYRWPLNRPKITLAPPGQSGD